MKNILIVTGGSGGHVVPSTSLFEHLKNKFSVKMVSDLRGSKYINTEKFKYELETHQSKLYEWRVKSNDPLLNRSFKWPSGIKLTDPDEANPNIISGCTE